MKKRKCGILLSSLAISVLFGCGKDIYNTEEKGEEDGKVEFILSADHKNNAYTKAGAGTTLNVDDFTIEIFNSNGVKIKRVEKYSSLKGEVVRMNKGNFKAKAFFGDSLATGFDVTYYAGISDFFVSGQAVTPVSIMCTQGNVQMKVVWGEHIHLDYSGYSVLVYRVGEEAKGVTFSKEETRCGFLPAGTIKLAISLTDNSGNSRVYTTPEYNYKANDFVTFNIDTKEQAKEELDVTFTVDDSTDEKPVPIKIPAAVVAKDAPSFDSASADGFTETSSGSYAAEFTEGRGAANNLSLGINAPGYIKKCIIKTVSGQGLPEEWPVSVDIADEDGSAGQIEILRNYGINWEGSLMNSKNAVIEFREFTKNIIRGTGDGSALFRVEVTDAYNKETGADILFNIKEASVIVNPVPSCDMWATKSYITVSTADGDVSKLSLQMSSDNGSTWVTPQMNEVSATATSKKFEVLSLNPGTEYKLRGAHFATNSETVTVTTEIAGQIGNAGFEEWKEWDYYVNKDKLVFGSSVYQTNYAPYIDGGERWWDCNNSLTTPGDRTPTGATYKSFPMVTYVAGNNSPKAAQIMTIAISNTATSGTCPGATVGNGRLFLGDYDNGVNERPFTSRPSGVRFDYKYTPHDSDSFAVNISVKGENGEVIGTAQYVSPSGEVSQWSSCSVEIAYSNKEVKAQSISVEFLSSSASGTPPWGMGKSITYGGGKTAGVHGGSILTIDNVELLY